MTYSEIITKEVKVQEGRKGILAGKPKGGLKVSARNVSKQLLKAMRKDRKEERKIETAILLLDRMNQVDYKNSKKQRLTKIEQVWDAKFKVLREAEVLFDAWESKGVTWAACVQAVKTDRRSERTSVWSNKFGHVKLPEDFGDHESSVISGAYHRI